MDPTSAMNPTPAMDLAPAMDPDAPSWVPHPYLEEDLIPILQRTIDHIPASHLLPPVKNETFDTPDDAWTRLQDYTFNQNFAIITDQCGKADPRKAYKCIHHSGDTKN